MNYQMQSHRTIKGMGGRIKRTVYIHKNGITQKFKNTEELATFLNLKHKQSIYQAITKKRAIGGYRISFEPYINDITTKLI